MKSEKSEKAAKEIEKILEEQHLSIDPDVLRDILAEELEHEGGDVECKATPVDSSVSQSDAAPTVQAAGAACAECARLRAELDLRDKREAETMVKWLKKLSDQIDKTEKLQEELREAKQKAYTDYREYVGLVSQNEALRRQVDELQSRLNEL